MDSEPKQGWNNAIVHKHSRNMELTHTWSIPERETATLMVWATHCTHTHAPKKEAGVAASNI